MRGPWNLTPQAAQAAVDIFQSLGLREAHYKPTPILPSTTKEANSGAADFQSGGGAAVTYQVAGDRQSIHLPHQHYNESNWGQPSYLLLPKDSGSSYKSSATVGPGSCSVINSSYTPIGGWSTLPGNDSFDAFDDTQATIFRYRKPVGVSLGSWFVSESWMTPSLFGCAAGNATAELDILEGFGSSASGVSNASAFMNQHWDTWVREEDFQKMAGLGINTVRMPIGYWTLGGNWTDNTPFAPWADVYTNSWRYLVRGIQWASKYNIGVLVDLHGAYGAANADATSGVSNGEIGFFTPGNESLTTALLTNITQRLVNVTNVVGIELLNEPDDQQELWPWYNATLDTLRTVPGAASFPFYVQDAFDVNAASQLVSQRQDFVVVDSHMYYVYTAADKAESAANHTRDIVGSVNTDLQASTSQSRGNLVIGEWSCALAPQSLANVSNPQAAEREFCQAEYSVFGNSSVGTVYWAWTMENCEDNAGWCFQAAAKEYLTSPFNLWNISNATYGQINNLNGTGQVALASAIAKNLSSLAIPTLPAGSLPDSGSSSGSSSGSGSGSTSASTSGSSSVPSSSSLPNHWASSTSSARASHSSAPTSSSAHGTSKSHAGLKSSRSSSGSSSSVSSSGSNRSSSSHASHHPTHSSSHSYPSSSARAPISSSSSTSRHPSHSSHHSHATSSFASSSSSESTSTAVPSHSASASHSQGTPSKSVVTMEWSKPITITTSLEISGQATLTLPPGRSTSTATSTTPSSSAFVPSNSHSAHHDHHASSSPAAASSHSAHSSSASASTSTSSSSTPADELPGWIVGRSVHGMRGGSPAARAAAAARQARLQAEELAKRHELASLTNEHRRALAVAAAVLNVHHHESGPSGPRVQTTKSTGSHAGQQVASTGYSDGFVSAKIFASDNLGRIGFAEQYIQDSWNSRLHSGQLERTDHSTYAQAFQQGLDDAHTQITDLIETAAAAAM